jgi:hypothetical protein
MFRKSSGSPMSPLGLARMKPSFNFHPTTNVTFDDVAGCDGAKLELAEVVDFLKNPESYTNNGCIIPRGVLLHGPPGTGEWIKGRTCLLGSIMNHAHMMCLLFPHLIFRQDTIGQGRGRRGWCSLRLPLWFRVR